MASISSLSGSSSTSSIYGTRNVISGLASGIDTESLIQNAVSGYETKISSLNQKRTKLEWQQEAFRGIISKMASFSGKYTSYTSSTNLMSTGFFNNAVKVSTLGANKDKVSATGRTSSDVQLLGVKQLATSASYSVSGGALAASATPTIKGGELKLDEKYEESTISGSLTLGYGGSTQITIDIDGIKDGGTDVIKTGQELADEINAALKKQNIALNGNTYTADQKIQAKWNDTDKTIEFEDIGGGGNGAYVLSASGELKNTLGIESKNVKDGVKSISVGETKLYDDTKTYADKLKKESISFTLDGKTKQIDLSDYSFSDVNGLQSALESELNKAFGKDKVSVSVNGGGLSFEIAKGSTLKISNGKTLGLSSNSETSYTNTSKTLGEILGGSFDWENKGTMIEAKGAVTEVAATEDTAAYFKDEDGNRVAKNEDGNYYRVDENNNWLHALQINGETVGAFSKETALESVMTKINGNADVDLSLSFSKTTNQFKFTAGESGETGNIRIENDGGLAAALFGHTVNADGSYVEGYTAGRDAVFKMSVNGEEMEVSRSSNSFEVDGLTVNLKGTFGYELGKVLYKSADESVTGKAVYEAAEEIEVTNSVGGKILAKYVDEDGYYCNEKGQRYMQDGDYTDGQPIAGEFKQEYNKYIEGTEAVTFETAADADTIVDAIKSMVEDYNAMVREIKEAYSTLPLQKSSGAYYEPLTESDEEGMSESAIESYEEKAKTGLLFGDRDLSNLYTRMTQAVQSVGLELESIGISTSYDDGLTTLSLNESKLRSKLEADPDAVRDAFTRSKSSGASTDGLMQALKTPLDMYASTTGAAKGILVEKAGSSLAPTSVYQNTIQKQLDELDKQIEKWQDKLSDKVDYYTNKFTQLELLINEMNSQSSALSSLTGSY